MNSTFRILFSAALVAAVALACLPVRAHAQASGTQDAGAKIRGDVYWPGRASGRYIESARNFAQEVQTFVTRAPARPEPSVVKDVKADLTQYLDQSKTHLAAMKKDFAGDNETVAAVEGLEKDLDKAIHHNKEMIACCEHQTFDKVATMACCNDLVKELDKIHKDHVTLMQNLKRKYGSATTK